MKWSPANVVAWLMPLLLALVIGCGGGGGSRVGGAPLAQTRQQIKEGFGRSILSMAQSGAFGGVVSGTSGSTSGGGFMGGGVPYIGGYVFWSGMGGTTGGTGGGGREVGTGGGTGGSGGSGTSDLYYDEYLGLWAQYDWTETTSTTHLYEDEAKTKPAGSFNFEYDLTFSNYTSTFEITAGNYAGAHGSYVTAVDGNNISSTYENFWPGWGSDRGEMTWNDTGGTWSNRSDAANGDWWENSGSYSDTGQGTVSGSDSHGFKYRFNYNPDGTGNGRVEGPVAGLPCTIEWLADGSATITWADGTVERIGPADWGFGGGTSGGGGGDVGTTGGG